MSLTYKTLTNNNSTYTDCISFRRAPHYKKNDLGMVLNWFWQWGSSSIVLGSTLSLVVPVRFQRTVRLSNTSTYWQHNCFQSGGSIVELISLSLKKLKVWFFLLPAYFETITDSLSSRWGTFLFPAKLVSQWKWHLKKITQHRISLASLLITRHISFHTTHN